MIAATVPVHQLRDEFLRLYPQYELVASDENLPTREAAVDWQTAHEQFVSAADWTELAVAQETLQPLVGDETHSSLLRSSVDE